MRSAFTIQLHKMIKPLYVLLLLFFCATGYGQFKPVQSKEKPYLPGEKLSYTVKFGPIIGGTATLTLRQVYYNDKIVYHSRGEGKTVGLAEKLYSVKDIFESYFDTETGMPYKLVRDVQEGSYKKHEEAYFDRDAGTAYSLRLDTTLQVPADILDMISLLYYVRILDMSLVKPGDVMKTVTYFDDELFPFEIRYKGIEEVRTKFGKIKCYRYDPVVEPGRMFESEDDMTIWLSADKNIIPIKVKFDLVVGSLKMELEKYSNLKYPLKFKKD
jgi:hypothetical protein